VKTRLDPVVRFRETKEQRALEGLAKATDLATQASSVLDVARARASEDGRGRGDASEWMMVEVARERALGDVKRATELVRKSTSAVEIAREAWRLEHRQTEVVRRVADARREEARVERSRRDTRELDELGSMMFVRKRA